MTDVCAPATNICFSKSIYVIVDGHKREMTVLFATYDFVFTYYSFNSLQITEKRSRYSVVAQLSAYNWTRQFHVQIKKPGGSRLTLYCSQYSSVLDVTCCSICINHSLIEFWLSVN